MPKKGGRGGPCACISGRERAFQPVRGNCGLLVHVATYYDVVGLGLERVGESINTRSQDRRDEMQRRKWQ